MKHSPDGDRGLAADREGLAWQIGMWIGYRKSTYVKLTNASSQWSRNSSPVPRSHQDNTFST
jgi:hypothetical protein